MSGQAEHWVLEVNGIEQIRPIIAEDLLTLAGLHARPLERDEIMALWRDCYHGMLGLQVQTEALRHAVNLLCVGLTDIPTCLDERALETLSTAYREIYTDAPSGAQPYESLWCMRGVSKPPDSLRTLTDWQRRFDFRPRESLGNRADHLATELQLLAHLASSASGSASLADLANFMDQHLLRWVDRFALRVGECTQVRWYQGLAALTAAYLDELRAVIFKSDGVGCGDIAGNRRSAPQGLGDGVSLGSTQASNHAHV